MKDLWTVATFTIKEMIKRKSFIISNIIILLIIILGFNVPNIVSALDKNGEFSEKEMENSRTCIIAGIKNIESEQDTEIIFYMGQELSQNYYSINDYIEKIKSVTREQVIEFVKSFKLNTIYFLSNQEK